MSSSSKKRKASACYGIHGDIFNIEPAKINAASKAGTFKLSILYHQNWYKVEQKHTIRKEGYITESEANKAIRLRLS